MDEATGREWRTWVPETCREFVKLNDTQVQQFDKLMATQVVVTNPDVFDTWHLWNACAVAFNHRRASFEWLDKPDVNEAAWAAYVFRKLMPEGIYSTEVLKYLEQICRLEGLLFFPWIGGDGLVVDDVAEGTGSTVQEIWKAGALSDLDPSDVDPENPLHVQLAAIVRAQAYIRAQKSEAAVEKGA